MWCWDSSEVGLKGQNRAARPIDPLPTPNFSFYVMFLYVLGIGPCMFNSRAFFLAKLRFPFQLPCATHDPKHGGLVRFSFCVQGYEHSSFTRPSRQSYPGFCMPSVVHLCGVGIAPTLACSARIVQPVPSTHCQLQTSASTLCFSMSLELDLVCSIQEHFS